MIEWIRQGLGVLFGLLVLCPLLLMEVVLMSLITTLMYVHGVIVGEDLYELNGSRSTEDK